MRVFDIYWFNIADKVKFKDTQPYLKNMLAEFGFTWSDLAFSAQNASDDSVIARIQQKFPKLEKYFRSTKYGSMLCSYTDNWFNGELFAEKSDYDDIFTLFSKVPRPFKISSGHILLNGVNWFGEEPAAPVSDCTCEEKDLIYITDADYFSNHIAQHRNYDDGLKYNRVSVCIETTAVPEPRDSSTVIEKLIPYLGKPYWSRTHCVFSKEESLRNKELSGKHSEYIKNLIKNTLPNPEKYPYTMNDTAPIPHLADIPTMKKAFAGTGFMQKKGNPGWLGEYDCRDSHGYLYKAFVQKLSDGCSFRVWLEISGCNFNTGYLDAPDYCMKEEGESFPIIREFALLCAKIRDEYGDKLAADFGDTPKWYYKS